MSHQHKHSSIFTVSNITSLAREVALMGWSQVEALKPVFSVQQVWGEEDSSSTVDHANFWTCTETNLYKETPNLSGACITDFRGSRLIRNPWRSFCNWYTVWPYISTWTSTADDQTRYIKMLDCSNLFPVFAILPNCYCIRYSVFWFYDFRFVLDMLLIDLPNFCLFVYSGFCQLFSISAWSH